MAKKSENMLSQIKSGSFGFADDLLPAIAETSPEVSSRAAPKTSTKSGTELMGFRLGGEEYAFMLREMLAIVRTDRLEPYPTRLNALVGGIHFRNDIVPVLDLRKVVGLASQDRSGNGGQHAERRIVVVESGDRQVGFVVDRTTRAYTVGYDAIDVLSDDLGQSAVKYIDVVARFHGRRLFVLSISRLLENVEVNA